MPISNEVVYQHPRNSSKCFLVVLSVIRTVSKRWHSLWGVTQRKRKLSVCFRHQLTSITASCIKYNSKQMYEHIVKIPQFSLGLSVPLPIYLPVYLANNYIYYLLFLLSLLCPRKRVLIFNVMHDNHSATTFGFYESEN